MIAKRFGGFVGALVAGLSMCAAGVVLAQTPAGITGTYTGTYRCPQGAVNARLLLLTTAAGEVAAQVTVYLPPGTQTKAYTYRLFGQYSPTNAKLSLMPQGWEGEQPPNFAMMAMNGTWDSNELTGTTSGGNCSVFQLERDGAQSTRAQAPAAAAAKSPAAAKPQPGAKPQTPAGAKSFADAKAELEKADAQDAKDAAAATNPVLKWMVTTKKDALTDSVTTQLTAQTFLDFDRGDTVQATAQCNDNGIAVFFYLNSYGNLQTPQFTWGQDPSDGSPTIDVRMRVDGGGVHVAKGYPDKKGSSFLGNSLGLLFYEPGLVARSARESQDAATLGIPQVDSFFGPLLREAGRSAAQQNADNSAGPLNVAVTAKSIRIELLVNGYDENPVLDLNPQHSVFHKFATDCSSRFSRGR